MLIWSPPYSTIGSIPNALSICLLVLLLIPLPGQTKELIVVNVALIESEYKGTFLTNLLNNIYPEDHYQLKTNSYPFLRAVQIVTSKQADIVPGLYKSEDEHLYLSRHPYIMYNLAIAIDSNLKNNWKGMESLAGLRVGAQIGDHLQEYFPPSVDYLEYRSLEGMIKMLIQGRVNAVIGGELDIKLIQKNFGDSIAVENSFLQVPIYLGFAHTDKGNHLKMQFDKAFLNMLETGTLKLHMSSLPVENYEDYYPFIEKEGKYYPKQ